jgi:two-component system NtrC family sensor kinase
MRTGLLPMLPVAIVDIVGSASMILLSILSFRSALALKRKEPQNIIWTFLVWFSAGLLIFALSRSVGHILKHLLDATDLTPVWRSMRPVSGSLNTIAFILVGSITLFFSRVYRTYRRMLEDKASIERANQKIAKWNLNLENMILERTRDLSASEEKYRRVFENSKDMLFICDVHGTIKDINPCGVDLLGLDTREGAVGRNLFEWLDPGEADRVRLHIIREGYVKDVELSLRRSAGENLTVLLSGTAVYGEGEKPAEVEGTVKDITGRKQMELQLLQADKLASLGQLSAGIAHEINNPLGLVLGYTKLVLKEAGPEKEFNEDLKIIEKHALNCKKIVENLLKFSRATSTTKSLVDLHDLIRDVMEVVGNKFRLERVGIETRLAPELPKVQADPDKIRQVFMNILMNGRQAIEGAGTIIIVTSFDRQRGIISIRFTDTGGGIPQEIIHKIFDPFFTTKPTGMGTGLGLAVSYGIVKDHDGEIRVESTPGQGSAFTVELPVIEPDSRNAHHEARKNERG